MTRPFVPKAVSANDLLLGDVVYFTPNGDWSSELSSAAIANNSKMAEQLLMEAGQSEDRAVDPYLIDVELVPTQEPRPVKYREVLRTLGPSNRLDLGKQAGC